MNNKVYTVIIENMMSQEMEHEFDTLEEALRFATECGCQLKYQWKGGLVYDNPEAERPNDTSYAFVAHKNEAMQVDGSYQYSGI